VHREIARMLADDQRKRVVIVDTSNEIGGDGDVPHAGIGRARRMQVPNVNMQHNVSIKKPHCCDIAQITRSFTYFTPLLHELPCRL
jgi:stage III sporulation protein SpoIIIAA